MEFCFHLFNPSGECRVLSQYIGITPCSSLDSILASRLSNVIKLVEYSFLSHIWQIMFSPCGLFYSMFCGCTQLIGQGIVVQFHYVQPKSNEILMFVQATCIRMHINNIIKAIQSANLLHQNQISGLLPNDNLFILTF